MRERLARQLTLATAVMVLLLAALFAWKQGGDAARQTPADETGDPAVMARGAEVLEREGCLRCHAVAGRGNPRNSLDGVASRRAAAELGQWITAEGAAAAVLPPPVARAKERYRALPPDDIEALIKYLRAL